MRILTVRQPWAWAIIHAGKDVENRVRSLGPYRGPVAIHAGVHPYAQDTMASRVHRATHGTEVGTEVAFGAVIGIVDLTDVHAAEDCWRGVALLDGTTHTEQCSEWAMSDHHHLCLANPRALARPIPATGKLGLWNPDERLLNAIREQVSA